MSGGRAWGRAVTGLEQDAAQRWHDVQSIADPQHADAYSSCWCCCTRCNPAWTEGAGNPHFEAARAEMLARVPEGGR